MKHSRKTTLGWPRWVVCKPNAGRSVCAALPGSLTRAAASSMAQGLATAMRTPLALAREAKAPRRNPAADHRTLVHAGYAQAAQFHLFSGRGAPLADLYVGKAWAMEVARLFADHYGEPTRLVTHQSWQKSVEHENAQAVRPKAAPRPSAGKNRRNPKALAAGTRVSAVVYGERREGVVLEQKSPGVVWVRWDGSPRRAWMHADSLKTIKVRRNPETPVRVGTIWTRLEYPQHLAIVRSLEGTGADAMVNADVITYGGKVMGHTRDTLSGWRARWEPQDAWQGRKLYGDGSSGDKRGRRRNPSTPPAKGQVWRTRAGDNVRVQSVNGITVHYLNTSTGNRDSSTVDEFIATHRAPAQRTNPKRRARRNPAGLDWNAVEEIVSLHYGDPRPATAWERKTLTAQRLSDPRDAAYQVAAWRHAGQSKPPAVNPRTRRAARRNPADAQLAKAKNTFEMWHEFPAKKLERVRVANKTMPKYLVRLGEVRRIDYDSNKWEGKSVTYTHTTKRPRPILATDPDARQLYLVGGKMRPTADGLVN